MRDSERLRRPERLGAVADAALNGAVVCVWYAMPDHLPGRGRRAAAKTFLLLVGALPSIRLTRRDDGPQFHVGQGAPPVGTARRGKPTAHEERTPGSDEEVTSADDGAGTGEEGRSSRIEAALARLSPAAAIGLVGGIVVLATAGTVAQERLLHRLGERLARRGVSYPHTHVGLALGAVVAVSSVAGAAGSGHVGGGSGRAGRTRRDLRHIRG